MDTTRAKAWAETYHTPEEAGSALRRWPEGTIKQSDSAVGLAAVRAQNVNANSLHRNEWAKSKHASEEAGSALKGWQGGKRVNANSAVGLAAVRAHGNVGNSQNVGEISEIVRTQTRSGAVRAPTIFIQTEGWQPTPPTRHEANVRTNRQYHGQTNQQMVQEVDSRAVTAPFRPVNENRVHNSYRTEEVLGRTPREMIIRITCMARECNHRSIPHQ